jgi:hypothetical protein
MNFERDLGHRAKNWLLISLTFKTCHLLVRQIDHRLERSS